MNSAVVVSFVALVVIGSTAAPDELCVCSRQSSAGEVAAARQSEGTLPADVHPESRSRLPLIKRDNLDDRGKRIYDASLGGHQAASVLRLHRSGSDVRWRSPLGRPLTELAIVSTAREYDQPYEWSLHAMEALAVGQQQALLDVVRFRKPLIGVGEKEAIIIELARDLYGKHMLSSATYARALRVLGEQNLVDVIDLTSGWARFAPLLSAFNQHLPPGWKQTLPLSFSLPEDFLPDSRNRLPLNLVASQNKQIPSLYSRSLSPEGTGPGQISRHGAGIQSLEASIGRRSMALAILIAARAHDQQYDWTMNEIEALKEGLEPSIIDVVQSRKPTAGLNENDASLIEFGRDLFAKHNISAETYARALKVFGERDLVDITDLMGQHASDAAMLTAFDQHLPSGQKPLLRIAEP